MWIDKTKRLISNYLVNRLFKYSDLFEKLNYNGSVAKRLNEHREVVNFLISDTCIEDSFIKSGYVYHMSVQDDYLMRLFYLVYGVWPDKRLWPDINSCPSFVVIITPRPQILGECGLPEYPEYRYGTKY